MRLFAARGFCRFPSLGHPLKALHLSKRTVLSPLLSTPVSQKKDASFSLPPPAVSPARHKVAASSVSPAGASNAHVATSVSATWLCPASRTATSPPPLALVSALWSFACDTDSLHPSTGATCPSGVRHEYTWYCLAHALTHSTSPRITSGAVAATTAPSIQPTRPVLAASMPITIPFVDP